MRTSQCLGLILFALILQFRVEAVRNSMYGPSGMISIPTAEKVKQEEETLALWYSFGSNDDYLGFSTSLSIADVLEFSAYNDSGSRLRGGSSAILSLKYTPDTRFALGYMHDLHSQHRDLVYGVYGKPDNGLYLGGGLTLGSEPLAVLGNFSRTSAKVNRTFFMAGVKSDMSEILAGLTGTMEFNGDTTNFGLSYKPENYLEFHVNYFTRGDYNKDDKYVLATDFKF